MRLPSSARTADPGYAETLRPGDRFWLLSIIHHNVMVCANTKGRAPAPPVDIAIRIGDNRGPVPSALLMMRTRFEAGAHLESIDMSATNRDLKICFIGPSGAGKTTLARRLSQETGIPHIPFDEIYWDTASGDYLKRSNELIDEATERVRLGRCWIVEGSYDKRLLPFFRDANWILMIQTSLHVRVLRLLKRYVQGKFRAAGPVEKFANTMELIRFTSSYPAKLSGFLQSHPELLEKTLTVSTYENIVSRIGSRSAVFSDRR
ncbi:AAA family ATPase [Cupriavidus sp. PET2-C1]